MQGTDGADRHPAAHLRLEPSEQWLGNAFVPHRTNLIELGSTVKVGSAASYGGAMDDDRRDRRSRITLGVATGVVTVAAGIASNIIADTVAVGSATTVAFGAAAVGLAAVTWLISSQAANRGNRAAARSRQDFQAVAKQAVTSVEQTLPQADVPLEDEIAEVSASLSMTVGRLRRISEKAEAFEAEVASLVARAEAAKATASVHEADARRIALFLGSETESRLRHEIEKLAAEHDRQIERLRRSGNRVALWTFAGGVVLGVLGNVVVAVLMR